MFKHNSPRVAPVMRTFLPSRENNCGAATAGVGSIVGSVWLALREAVREGQSGSSGLYETGGGIRTESRADGPNARVRCYECICWQTWC